MADIDFTLKLAQQFYESEEDFPVDFEFAWQWLGYSRKDAAKRALEKNFVEGQDHTLHKVVERVKGNNNGGSVVSEEIRLTANCLKEMGMMAGTEKR